MSDLETLETSIMADIAAAADEQAIEAVRVAAISPSHARVSRAQAQRTRWRTGTPTTIAEYPAFPRPG